MAAPFLEPTADLGDTKQVLLAYLDFFRSTVVDKLHELTPDQLRTTVLPSGWTPLELVKHLSFMERRWLVWGFLGEPVPHPWGDRSEETGRWYVGPQETPEELLDALAAGGRRTRDIVSAAQLSALAARGGRFEAGEPAPSLERILLHVLQEYARHAGHLDVVRELMDGNVGE